MNLQKKSLVVYLLLLTKVFAALGIGLPSNTDDVYYTNEYDYDPANYVLLDSNTKKRRVPSSARGKPRVYHSAVQKPSSSDVLVSAFTDVIEERLELAMHTFRKCVKLPRKHTRSLLVTLVLIQTQRTSRIKTPSISSV